MEHNVHEKRGHSPSIACCENRGQFLLLSSSELIGGNIELEERHFDVFFGAARSGMRLLLD